MKTTCFLTTKKIVFAFLFVVVTVSTNAWGATPRFPDLLREHELAELAAFVGAGEDQELQGDCAICLCSLEEGEVTRFQGRRQSDAHTGCHLFHRDCLPVTLLVCPLCRRPHIDREQLTIERLERVYWRPRTYKAWLQSLFC